MIKNEVILDFKDIFNIFREETDERKGKGKVKRDWQLKACLQKKSKHSNLLVKMHVF